MILYRKIDNAKEEKKRQQGNNANDKQEQALFRF
jgi:hypothetical protein